MTHPEDGLCDAGLLFERLENVYNDLHVGRNMKNEDVKSIVSDGKAIGR